MTAGQVLGMVALAFVAWIFISGRTQPAPTIEGKETIKYASTDFHFGWRQANEGVGVLEVKGTDGRTLARYTSDRNDVLHLDPGKNQLTAVYTPHSYLGEWTLDVGAFAAAARRYDGSLTGTIGIRVSPCRILFDTISPDLVISDRAIGAGFSIFAPRRAVGASWSRFGIGGWYLASLDQGSGGGGGGPSGPAIGLSFSTAF